MTLPLNQKIKEDLIRALGDLEYSLKKIQSQKLVEKSDWTEEDLEILESFSSRFARASDLFLSHYLRLILLQKDPAFRGSFIDLLNLAEKSELIKSSKSWFRIRALRNIAAHEYMTDDLKSLYGELVTLTPLVLSIRPTQ